MLNYRYFLILIFMIIFYGLCSIPGLAESTGKNTEPSIQEIKWLEGGINEALQAAEKTGKDVMLYIYTDSCDYCHYMQENIFTDPKVVEYVDINFISLKIKKSSAEKSQLDSLFLLYGSPIFLLLNSDGKEIDRFKGKYELHDFLHLLKKGKQNIGTLDYYLKQKAQFQEDPQLLFKILLKYASRYDIENLLLYHILLKKKFPDYYSENTHIILDIIQEVYYVTGKYEAAAEVALQVLDKVLYPEVRQRYDFIASCFKNLGSFEQALKMYYNILLLFPEDILAYIDFIQMAWLSGLQLDLALEEGIKGMLLSAPEKYKAELIFNLAGVYEKKGMLDRAMEMADNAYKMDPKANYHKYKLELERRIVDITSDEDVSKYNRGLIFSHEE